MMKRTWILAAAIVATVGVAAVAQAQGFGYGSGTAAGGTAQGQGMMAGSAAKGQGMMAGGAAKGQGVMVGGAAKGQGMMAGSANRGQGMMNRPANAANCTGENYDPATAAARIEDAIAQHERMIETLEARLAQSTDEATTAFLNGRIELQKLMLAYQNEKLPAVQSASAEFPEGAIALAQFDVDYFSKATATDAKNQAWIANRLAQAQERLAALQEQQQ